MPHQRHRHRQHGNPFALCGDVQPIDWPAVFGRTAPLALDIGFGLGGFLLELATRHPEWNVVGLEIRPFLVNELQQCSQKLGFTNVKAVLANANLHLNELIPNQSVKFVAINFPDPWYKNRHHKRRVVQPKWLEILLPKLLPGAEIHAQTDYEPLALAMRTTFESSSHLASICPKGQFVSHSTTGIQTEREKKHQARNQPIYRMCFIHIDCQQKVLLKGV